MMHDVLTPDMTSLCRGSAPGTGWNFSGLPAPAVLPADGLVAAALRRCLNGWPMTRAVTTASPLCTISPDDAHPGAWRYDAPGLETPMTGLTDTSAACAAIADLSVAWCRTLKGGIGLHCGAVEVGGRVIAITGPRRAGKSTLIARLSAEPGMTVYCDDVLPVTGDRVAVALGVCPRLRLPLPRGAGDTLRRHLRDTCVERDDRYAYLHPASLAPHGRRAPLGALVSLRRGPRGTPAALHHLPRAAALRLLLVQSLTAPEDAEAAFALADRLTEGLPAYTLTVSDLDEASGLLARLFDPATPIGPALPDPAPRPRRLVPPDRRYRAATDAALRTRDGGAFLWRAGDTVLWQLNPVAQAVWLVLSDAGAEGMTPRELAGVLAEAFPDAPDETLLRDVRALFVTLAAYGFAQPVA